MIHDDLKWLIDWFKICHERYGEGRSIRLGSIDTPGWLMTIDLADTCLADKELLKVDYEYSEHEWIQCWVKDAVFYGVCGTDNLAAMLSIFRLWACDMDYLSVIPTSITQLDTDDDFCSLINWRNSHCNGDWEYSFGVHLTTISKDKPGWKLLIDVAETELEGTVVEETSVLRSHDDWYSYGMKKDVYEGRGGLANLSDILDGFRVCAKTQPSVQ